MTDLTLIPGDKKEEEDPKKQFQIDILANKEKGVVIIDFLGEKVTWVAFTPQQVIVLCKLLLAKVKELSPPPKIIS